MSPMDRPSRTDGYAGGNGRRVAVIVDGSPGSVPALRQAASQARQRNATLDVICLLPEEADAHAVTLARVRLGEFSRRTCPYGVGAPVRFRIERGDVDTMLPVIRADVELLVPGPGMVADQAAPRPVAGVQPAVHRSVLRPGGTWLRTLLHA